MKIPKCVWKYSMLPIVMTSALFAQDELDDEEDIYEMSPFVIETEEDSGYQATSTLAGTRVKTDLKDIASSISVVTAQFLQDTGATDNESLLQYTTNTEVGGLYGNFSGLSNVQGVEESAALIAPSSNTRVRGLDSADNTRNYFQSNIPWDGYNVDRVDLQRGPNSILFGVGSPAGIINTGTIIPTFENKGKFENRIGMHGSMRNTLDYNHVLIDDKLAVRVAAVIDHEKYQQRPAFEDDERVFGTFVYNPDWFGDIGNTTIRGNFEKGDITANRPRMLPPMDNITPFFDGLNKQVYDPAWAWEYGAMQDRGGSGNEAFPEIVQPWLGNSMGGAYSGNSAIMDINNGVAGWIDFAATTANAWGALNADGEADNGLGGYPFSRRMGIAGFNEYSKNAEALDPTSYPSAAKNFYKDRVLSDPNVFNFYDNLIDGDNKREWSDWTAYNFAIEQTFFSNRLGMEFVYDYQDYEQGSENFFGGSTGINVDVNTHTNRLPTSYFPDEPGGEYADPTGVVGGEINPNVGRAYVTGFARGNNRIEQIERENMRLTVFGEINGNDFFYDHSWLAKLIGRNVFTGLISRDERNDFNRNWSTFAMPVEYATRHGNDGAAALDGYTRAIGYTVYLSDDLRNYNSASGLGLDRIKTKITVPERATVRYFNPTWNSDVDPGAFYYQPFDQADSTQSENPSNYVGWVQDEFDILHDSNANEKEQLYTVADKRTEILDSQALTWQGYLFDGNLVPTYGWRKDTIETWGSSGIKDELTKVPSLDFDNSKGEDGTIKSEGETVSWGVVAHSPEFINRHLPKGTKFSFFLNKSKNFRAENRVGFDTKVLPNPEGKSEDYGIVLRTLDDKLTFKVTWYETTVTDANIPGGNALGNNTYFLYNMEAWGTAKALKHEMYWAGMLPGAGWESNYGMIDDNLWGAEGWENAPFSDEAINHPANVAQRAAVADWYATMPSQEFFDGYGLPVDRSKAEGTFDDRLTMVDNGNWSPWNGVGSIQAAGGGNVNGLRPVGTINQESKGIEFEVTAQPLPNWNITFNASKTDATRTDLGVSLVNFIESTKARLDGPAGDLRLWWGGDNTFRHYYDQNIYQAYLFQLDSNGSAASEIRPWRFNIISNYSFDDGTLKGANVGFAYRWQDDAILGYRLNEEKTKMDINNPIKGGAEGALDAWMGYGKDLKNGVHWRVQLNLRNVGKDDRLIPISVNPDGSAAAQRIGYGMSWSLTNTFSF